ncbi:MAG: cysteine peptidase family C39 domain-containing protein [Syntrophorhabdaceae bacterium]|nr:cysteine peptidase family C39 domain-containing protein [Syntrophorhabdaceae bacterium]
MPPVFRFIGAALLLVGAFFLIGGCASLPAGGTPVGVSSRETRIIPGVLFLPQEEETCGPTSLAMFLRFHGKDVSVRELQEETRTQGLRGSLITDLAASARRRGISAEVASLGLPELCRRVIAGEPVILLVDLGMLLWSRPHYMVVYGVMPEGVVAHSGLTEGAVIPYGQLENQWEKMGRLAIVAPARERSE